MTVPLRAGVIGWPISHSRSPRLHGFWLEKFGIPGTYEAVAARPEGFEQTLRDLAAKGWRGANVTLPHKEVALSLADEATDRARAIGAANTLTFLPGGRIHADNTDAFGFSENLKERAGVLWAPRRPALVFGSGGAARAVIHALVEAGAPEIRLANRTRARADALAAEFGPKVAPVDWSAAEAALPGAGLLVNTTSLGMEGHPPLEFDLSAADLDALATDIVYTPLMTPFLERAAARGLATVDGIGMLIHQGRPGFHAWFGVEPGAGEAVRRHMLAP